MSAIGRINCTVGFCSVAIRRNCCTARCCSIWYCFFKRLSPFSWQKKPPVGLLCRRLRVATFYDLPGILQTLAKLRLQVDSDDVNALFAMTLSLGMQADYASLIEKRQLESLGMIRDADKFAKRLLVVNPDAADAYLTLGAANYIIGSLPALKRFFLHFKGISGDKRVGLQQLEIAASRGRYLRPFAKILLAMAALREKKTALARVQLAELVAEFPENPLFCRELAKLDISLTPPSLSNSSRMIIPNLAKDVLGSY